MKQLYSNTVECSEKGARNKKKEWSMKTVTRESRLVLRIFKQFEGNGTKAPIVCGRSIVVLLQSDIFTGTSSTPRMVPFSPFVRKENYSKPALAEHSPLRKERSPIWNGASFYSTKLTKRLRPKATIVKSKPFIVAVRKVFIT